MHLKDKDQRNLLAFCFRKNGRFSGWLHDLPIEESNFDKTILSLKRDDLLTDDINSAGLQISLTPRGMELGRVYSSHWWVWNRLRVADFIERWLWPIGLLKLKKRDESN